MGFFKRSKKQMRKRKKIAKNLSAEHENVLSEDSSFMVKEAYKSLRTNVMFSLTDDGCKTIAVSSALASEGKSINCLNLAISFAETGAKVLLVDCDLRRPNIARLLKENASPGVSNVLVHRNSLSEVIRHTPYKNLDVILTGDLAPNPVELIGSKTMEKVLAELARVYDYIFLDTPPINLVTDTSILSKLVSGIILIVRQNETEKGALLYAVNQLKFVGAKILGFVLNDVSADSGQSAYKYKEYERKSHND